MPLDIDKPHYDLGAVNDHATTVVNTCKRNLDTLPPKQRDKVLRELVEYYKGKK